MTAATVDTAADPATTIDGRASSRGALATLAHGLRLTPELRAGLGEGDGDAAGTVVVIAYRRATIALADEVVFVEDGRIAARGTHAELLETSPGYQDLVHAYERAELERSADVLVDEASEVRA